MSGNAVAAGCAAFSCGVILLYRLPVLPVWNGLIAGLFCLLLAAGVSRTGLLRSVSLLLVALLVGVAWAGWQAQERLAQRLPADLEGTPLTVRGFVCDLPAPASFRGLRFSFCVTHWPGRDADETLPDTLRLTWYQADARVLRQQRLELVVVLKRPHGTLNPAGFRYENWLFRHGFRATGSVRSAHPAADVPCAWACRYAAARQRLAEWVEARLGQARQYPLMASLMIGNRQGMTAEHWAVLKATGTVHLVAISGLHLGLVALAGGFLSRRLLLMLPAHWLPEWLLRQLVFVLTLACCLGYALIAGFTVPTRRALIMVALATWAVLRARLSSPWQTFLLALAWVLVSDPFAPLDQGFWLSFGAVAVLLLVFAGRLRQPVWVAGLVLAQVGVFAGLWPILASFGQGQPLAALVANLFAIPWLSVAVMPALALGAAMLVALPGAESFVIAGLDAVLGILWHGLELVSSWSWPQLPPVSGIMVLAAVLVLLALWVSATVLSAAVAVSCLLWLLFPAAPGNPSQETAVTILDVGQGLSVVVRDQGRVLVYDTGPAVEGVYSAVDSVLLPVLSFWGIRQIDHLVISHADRDHAGNLRGLLQRLPVARIESGEAEVIRARLSAVPVTMAACHSRRERFGSFDLSFWRSHHTRSGNNASCVLVLRHRSSGVEWILPGDIYVAGEREFLRDYEAAGPPPSYRVVVAPHHGSRTSSSAQWVAALAPDLVVYSAGYRHRFGHPHPAVVARYRAAGARALNTACSGSITFVPTASGPEVRESRYGAPFWISGPGLARAQCDIP